MSIFNDYPSNAPCDVANPSLWYYFSQLYYDLWKVMPIAPWSEAEVAQWIDMKESRSLEMEPFASD